MSKRTLNIRLLRSTRTIAQAFSKSFAPDGERAMEERDWVPAEGARLFVGQIYSNPPPWRSFIETGAADIPEGMFSGGAGAVIFIPVGTRILAVSFGHGHIALDLDAFERQFGLKVTLNAVPRGNLRSLDLATPDAITFQKRVQASKDSDVQDFGVDMLRDLARVAGGTPKDSAFADFVAGKDSLSITCEVDTDSLEQKCTEILGVYAGSEYKTEYKWVDQMRTVQEKDIVSELDGKLMDAIATLRTGGHSDLHLAPPEIVNYVEGCELHYNGFGSHGKTFSSLSISDYIAELNRCQFADGIDDLKSKHKISAKKADSDKFTEKWRLYDCFVFETSLTNNNQTTSYVMFAGDWYEIEKNFKKRIEAFYDEIDKVTIVGATTCRNEQILIDDLVATRPDLLKLDKEKINPEGVRYANLEPCDFFSINKEFIHLKDGHSSGSISHLWNQGVVSAEAFISDKIFRKKLRSKVKTLAKNGTTRFEDFFPKASEIPKRQDYKIVYGIMRKPYADGSLGIPFFSKVSLQASIEKIRQFGFPVALELIEKPKGDAQIQPAAGVENLREEE